MTLDTQKILEETTRFGAPNYNPLPVVVREGRGVWVWDTEDNKYIDCISGYSALNQGHCHPKIYQAMVHQAQKLALTSRGVYNEPMAIFLEKICHLSQMEMALPMNTGAEAVETAIKAMRKWGYKHKNIPEGKAEIIVAANNFHGRTSTIISFSDEAISREGFSPFMPGFKIIPFGDMSALEAAITPHTVGVLFEPIQGEAGVVIPPEGFLSAVRRICDKKNLILTWDEIQTGLGRTGKLFAHEHEEEAKPDLMLLGKALSGGMYPVSVVVGKREVLQVLSSGTHGSTYGGNPLGMAIAIAALDVIIEEKLTENAHEMGILFREFLEQIDSPDIKAVRGKGLMNAIDIDTAKGTPRDFCEKLLAVGVLAKDTREETIRFLPPLVITEPELEWLIKRIQLVFSGT